MPQQGQCPYCQLIDNPEQLLVVSETENFYAWLEINPRAKGHTQVVPKEHTESVLDLSEEEYDEMMQLVRKVIRKAENGLGADGASVTMNVGEAGGQMLPHAYVSVFPRFQDEENAGTPTGAIFPQRDELQQQLEEIHDSMSSASTGSGETREAHPDSKRHTEEKPRGGFSSDLVDREELEEDSKEESGKEEEEQQDDVDEMLEEEQEEDKQEDSTRDEETEDGEEDDGLEGEGHWDGKSFEWR